jgi:peptidoglycan LD-endopeptidase LytH
MTPANQTPPNHPQRRNVSSHSRVVVKRSLVALFPVLLTVLVLSNALGLSLSAGRIADRFLLCVHVAHLYMKDPDRQLSMPVPNASKKQVANTWHAPRGDRRHEGQDIFAPRGTPVLSATEGYILKIGENNLGGQTVSVIGSGGRTYYYAHLDSYAQHIAVGDYVTRETVLGYVGTTGNAVGTPPHLHFGVYASGGAMNPLPLLSDRPRPERKSEDRKAESAHGKKKR